MIGPLHLAWPFSLALVVVLLALFGLMLLQPLSWRLSRGNDLLARLAKMPGMRNASYYAMAFVSILLTMIAAREILWLVIGFDTIEKQRWSSIAVAGVSVLLLAWGSFQVWRGPRTVRVKIAIQKLPEIFSGFRIVQLSDIHIGESVRRPQIEKLVEKVNHIGADLVAITGDLVDGPVSRLATHAEPLGRLASKHGTFFVAGNHEHYSGLRSWAPHLEKVLGFTVLENEHRLITREGQSLVLAGVDDFSMTDDPEADVRRSLQGAPPSAIRILLAHQPKSAFAASKEHFDLQLSGHTHGGQFLPWNFLSRFVHLFTAGLYRVGEMWLYVSRGTFYWGPPVRLMAPAEITVIDLAAA